MSCGPRIFTLPSRPNKIYRYSMESIMLDAGHKRSLFSPRHQTRSSGCHSHGLIMTVQSVHLDFCQVLACLVHLTSNFNGRVRSSTCCQVPLLPASRSTVEADVEFMRRPSPNKTVGTARAFLVVKSTRLGEPTAKLATQMWGCAWCKLMLTTAASSCTVASCMRVRHSTQICLI